MPFHVIDRNTVDHNGHIGALEAAHVGLGVAEAGGLTIEGWQTYGRQYMGDGNAMYRYNPAFGGTSC